MALYSGAVYRHGHMGYVRWAAQNAKLIALNTLTCPALQTCTTDLGPCELAPWNCNDNTVPVDGVSVSRSQGQVPTRREWDFSSNVQVADGSMFPYFVRNRTTPSVGYAGLTPLVFETGFNNDFGADISAGWQGMDTLPNEVTFEFAESRPITARMGLIPVVVRERTTGQVPGAYASDILMWQHCQFTNQSIDYHDLFASATISFRNNIDRRGARQQYGALGAEDALSRCVYGLVPGMEVVGISLRMHDRLPSALRNPATWGDMMFYGAHPAGTATRRYLQIEIANEVLTRQGMGGAAANAGVEFTAELAAYGAVAITAGTL